MEYQQVLQSFDSLWFYATVISNNRPPESVVSAAVDPSGEEIGTPISQNEQNVEWNRVNNGGLGSEIRTEDQKEEKKRKGRRRKQLSFGERRKIEGEMNLCNAVKEMCECFLFEKRIGNGNCNYKMMKKKKIPPFADSVAMKEHIKSWAYAVACTVR